MAAGGRAAQSGRAVSVSRGDPVCVVDMEGSSVGDMWAVDAADHGYWLSVSHTRDRYSRLFPAVGGQFCDQRGEPAPDLAGSYRTASVSWFTTSATVECRQPSLRTRQPGVSSSCRLERQPGLDGPGRDELEYVHV